MVWMMALSLVGLCLAKTAAWRSGWQLHRFALAMPIAYQALAKARLHGCKLGLQKAWCQFLLGSGDTWMNLWSWMHQPTRWFIDVFHPLVWWQCMWDYAEVSHGYKKQCNHVQSYKFSCSERRAIPNGWNSFQNLKHNAWQVVGLQTGCDNCYCHWMLQGLCTLRFFLSIDSCLQNAHCHPQDFSQATAVPRKCQVCTDCRPFPWGHHEAYLGRMYLYVLG